MRGSLPEPPPKPEGIVIPDELIKFLENPDLIQLVKERNIFGISKYGQPLYSNDGRSGVEDARQELGDLLQYCFKVRISGTDEDKAYLAKLVESAFTEIRRILGPRKPDLLD